MVLSDQITQRRVTNLCMEIRLIHFWQWDHGYLISMKSHKKINYMLYHRPEINIQGIKICFNYMGHFQVKLPNSVQKRSIHMHVFSENPKYCNNSISRQLRKIYMHYLLYPIKCVLKCLVFDDRSIIFVFWRNNIHMRNMSQFGYVRNQACRNYITTRNGIIFNLNVVLEFCGCFFLFHVYAFPNLQEMHINLF